MRSTAAGSDRRSFQALCRLRLREVTTLLDHGEHTAAYHLMGLAVECALKACIAKQTRRHQFPDRGLAQRVHTHDLESLLRDAGLEERLRDPGRTQREVRENWAVVKDWNIDSRYSVRVSARQARQLHWACVDPVHGVLTWIRKRW